tara:strand:+ start:48301 stop:48735 length:435 start_codon:yes stop_codon:yes gene_type:complete
MNIQIPITFVILAGLGQMLTAIVYPYMRHNILYWFEDLKNLSPLNEAIAKTYGFYIQAINFSFGLLTILLAQELLIPGKLSAAITGFISIYWIGRITFQLQSYSFKMLENMKYYKLGIWSMNLLITYFALIYTLIFINNLIGIL